MNELIFQLIRYLYDDSRSSGFLSLTDRKCLFANQDKLCLPHHILEERGLVKVGVTVQALLDLPTSKPTHLSAI